jgi:hypothetical protein
MTFVVWGLFHGLGLAAERLIGQIRERRAATRERDLLRERFFARRRYGPPPVERARVERPWLGCLITFHLVCIGWVFFRSESIGMAVEMLWRALTAWGPAPLASGGLAAVIAGALAMQFLPSDIAQRFQRWFTALPMPAQGVALGAFLALAVVLGPTGVAPFIYYQF